MAQRRFLVSGAGNGFSFASRDDLVAWPEYLDGAIYSDGTITYIGSTGATAISDMPGLLPYGSNTPNHYKANDGSDMTAAIAAAHAYGNCTLLAETYNVSSTLTLSTASRKIQGVPGSKIQQADPFTGSRVILVTGSDNGLFDFEVDGDDQSTSGVDSNSNGISRLTFSGLKIRNCNYGMSITGSASDLLIENCDIAATANYSIRVQNINDTSQANGIKIFGNTFDRTDTTAATVTSGCLLVRGTATYYHKNVSIVGNTMRHVSNPTSTAGLNCEMRYVDGGTFTGNVCSGGSMVVSVALSDNVAVSSNTGLGQSAYGIEVAGISPTGCNNVSVTGNTIDGEGLLDYGVGLQGTSASVGCSVISNSIRGTQNYGVFVNAQWDQITISGNDIYVTETTGSQYGIYAIGPMEGVVISGNHIHGNGTGEKGVYLIDVTTSTVSGNVLDGWTQNDVYLQGTTSVNEVSVSGNTFASGLGANSIGSTGTIGANVRGVGNIGFRISNTLKADILDLASAVYACIGTSAPETLVTASPGSTYRRTTGGAGTTFYVKESGTGNTGWVGK